MQGFGTMHRFFFCLLMASLIGSQVQAMPMVILNQDHYEPGLAYSWTLEGSSMVFFLARDVDGSQLPPLLGPRMPNHKVSYANGKIYIQGPTGNACLSLLAQIDLPQEHDPMADLSVMGHTVVAQRAATGGGSIRAGKAVEMTPPEPQPMAQNPNLARPIPLADERFEAEVLHVERAPFPEVRLHLLIRKSPGAESLRHLLAKETRIIVQPRFSGVWMPLDLSQPLNQQLLLAFYLQPKDRILLRAQPPEGQEKTWLMVEVQRLEGNCPPSGKTKAPTQSQPSSVR